MTIEELKQKYNVMYGLLLKEPFGTQIVSGKKLIEYRTFNTPKRGTIAIIHKNMILGVVDIVDVKKIEEYNYHWLLSNAEKLENPVQVNRKNGQVVWVKL